MKYRNDHMSWALYWRWGISDLFLRPDDRSVIHRERSCHLFKRLYQSRGEQAWAGQAVSFTHTHTQTGWCTDMRTYTHTHTIFIQLWALHLTLHHPPRCDRWADKLDSLTATATQDPEGFLGHPVNAFKLMKRLNTEWGDLESLVLSDTTDGTDKEKKNLEQISKQTQQQ